MQTSQPLRRVLFVEDDQVLRVNYERYFRDRFEVAFAATGTEALVLLREFRPALVVLDLLLPDNYGLQLFHKLRERNGTLPVVVTTAAAEDEAVLRDQGLACDRFLLKPLALADLAAAIDAVG